jgi:hypothetical protein
VDPTVSVTTTPCVKTTTKEYAHVPAPSNPVYNQPEVPKGDHVVPPAAYGPANPKAKHEPKHVYGDISAEPLPAPISPETPKDGYEDGPILSSANAITVANLAVALFALTI